MLKKRRVSAPMEINFNKKKINLIVAFQNGIMQTLLGQNSRRILT